MKTKKTKKKPLEGRELKVVTIVVSDSFISRDAVLAATKIVSTMKMIVIITMIIEMAVFSFSTGDE